MDVQSTRIWKPTCKDCRMEHVLTNLAPAQSFPNTAVGCRIQKSRAPLLESAAPLLRSSSAMLVCCSSSPKAQKPFRFLQSFSSGDCSHGGTAASLTIDALFVFVVYVVASPHRHSSLQHCALIPNRLSP